MAIPVKYDRRMRRSWGMHAVWLPGTKFNVGDIVLRSRDGTYATADNLRSFGIQIQSTQSEALKTGFKTSSTKTRFFQAGAEVAASRVQADADASLKIEFTGTDGFMVATPIAKVETIDNLLAVSRQIRDEPSWNHNKWFIVRQVMTVNGFTVLGSETKGKKLEFSGKGKALLDFVTFGLTAGVRRDRSSQISVDFVGKKGALAMDLARIRRNGNLVVG